MAYVLNTNFRAEQRLHNNLTTNVQIRSSLIPLGRED